MVRTRRQGLTNCILTTPSEWRTHYRRLITLWRLSLGLSGIDWRIILLNRTVIDFRDLGRLINNPVPEGGGGGRRVGGE